MMRSYFWLSRFAVWLFAMMTVAPLGGCGYQFVGESSLLPKEARTIYVEPFVNRSRDVGLDKELTTALRGEFYRRGQLKIVDSAEQADVILSGVIRSFADSTVASVNRDDEVLQYESLLIMDVTLRRREPNEILWRGQGVRLNQVYAGSRAAVVTTSSAFRTGTFNSTDVSQLTDIQQTEVDRRATRDRLMEQFARELHQRVTEMF
ncbi:MAG TPA: LptE family protein [Candidatus Limnocylindrales bacterium]|jgi:outer membrane lipopolysaccharide assembly protein LptE/RlpB|nr:LptE family protein [Candidatus Limnocylindrales bacterium]